MHPPVIETIAKLHIQPSKYHGRQYEGNQCRLILKNIKQLSIPGHLHKFEATLTALRNLYILCNAIHLPANYTKVIDEFSFAWYRLVDEFETSTTPKLYIILDHLCYYFKKTGITLRHVTDELVENMHQFVDKRMVMSGYKVKDVTHASHGIKLYRAVRHINSYNLRINKNA